MKTTLKILIVIIGLLLNNNLISQAPEGINYQATVRNSSGNLMTNQSVVVIFTLKKTTTSGTVVYSETQTLTTNAYGGFVAIIGQGTTTSGTFSGISWGTNKHFLNVKVNGNDLGTTQLLSVPYALHAKTAEKLTDPIWKKKVSNGDYFTEGEPVIIGDSVSSASALTVKKNSVIGQLVDLKVNNLSSTYDILNLSTDASTSNAAQFIECRKGSVDKFHVNVDGSVFAKSKIKTDSTLIVGREVNRAATGSANIVPIAYGMSNSVGTKNSNASSPNFTVTYISVGTYDINITGVYINSTANTVLLSLKFYTGFINWGLNSGKLRIYTRNTSGVLTNRDFSFIVYKP